MASNTLLTISMITHAAARTLINSLGMSKHVNREYDSYFAKSGGKIGATLSIRKPSRYTIRSGATASIQDTVEQYVNVTLLQKGVDLAFTSAERTLSLENYTESVLVPAMATVANKIDYDGLQLALSSVYNVVGTAGTPPATADAVMAAVEVLDSMAAPDDGNRAYVMTPKANRSIIGGLSTLFNDQGEISKQYKSGRMRNALGFDFAMDQNTATVTVGATLAGTPVVNTSTGITDGTATVAITGGSGSVTNAILAGEVFTVAGVYSVNPQSRVSTGILQPFLVTANATSSSGSVTVSVSPTPVLTGAFQNMVINSAGASKAVVFLTGTTAAATYQNSLAFHKDAFVLATADLALPGGNAESHRVVRDGISVRVVEGYDIINDRDIIRFDVLYGWAAVYPEMAVRTTN